MPELPPAGWYQDPWSGSLERWWDGTSWGDLRRPAAPQPLVIDQTPAELPVLRLGKRAEAPLSSERLREGAKARCSLHILALSTVAATALESAVLMGQAAVGEAMGSRAEIVVYALLFLLCVLAVTAVAWHTRETALPQSLPWGDAAVAGGALFLLLVGEHLSGSGGWSMASISSLVLAAAAARTAVSVYGAAMSEGLWLTR